MSLLLEYKIFSNRNKKEIMEDINIKQEPILNSLVNTYALSLFVCNFYELNSIDDRNIFEVFEKLVNGEKDEQVRHFMEKMCRYCGEHDELIVNVPNFRACIKDFSKKDRSKRKHINAKLGKIYKEYYALIKLDQNLVPSQKQHINDKNSYMLTPNTHLESHVKDIKSRSIDDDEKFKYLQDAAFIMMCLIPGRYFWECEYTNFPGGSQLPNYGNLVHYLAGYIYEKAKFERFLNSVGALIIRDGLVITLDRDNQALFFRKMWSKVFEFEIFKDRYISFREDGALVIFSPKFFGNFDQIYDEIWKIERKVIKIKAALVKKYLYYLGDKLLLDAESIYEFLKKEDIFVLNKFKQELDKLQNDLSYKNFQTTKDRYARQWLIDNIYGLYVVLHAPLKRKDANELAKIYFEDLLGESLNLFIKKDRRPALGYHINDLEIL